MSVPPDMLARMRGTPAGGAPSPLPGGASPGPGGTPMAQPLKKEGNQEKAKVQAHIGMNMLEQALTVFGSESKEGQAILRALNALSRVLGKNDTSDLHPAQIKELVGSMPQMGGGSPMQQQILKNMQGARPANIPPAPAPMPAPM